MKSAVSKLRKIFDVCIENISQKSQVMANPKTVTNLVLFVLSSDFLFCRPLIAQSLLSEAINKIIRVGKTNQFFQRQVVDQLFACFV